MLNEAIVFINRNMKTKTVISKTTGKRNDIPEYPIETIREILLNALIHRDYSVHTQSMPIQINMFKDRIEITNPGGLYGRISIDTLGKVQADTRNPKIAVMIEDLGFTENRYTGIPIIKKAMEQLNLDPPIFTDDKNQFKVILKNSIEEEQNDIISFCSIPRSRSEIAEFFNVKSQAYAINTFIMPLVDKGKIFLTLPETPKSKNQKYYSK